MSLSALKKKVARNTMKMMVKEALRRKELKRTIQISDFQTQKLIGHGRYGKVWLSYYKPSPILVAIKSIEKKMLEDCDLWQQLFVEAELLSRLNHPNIIKLYTFFHDSTHVHFVLEFAYYGSLYSVMQNQKNKRLDDKDVAKYIYQTTSAVAEVHRLGYLHGDIKPENILVDHLHNAKLADFGLAWFYRKTSFRGLCGTKEYLPPEVIVEREHDQTIDNWSLGVMCYELLVGRSPFYSKRKQMMTSRIINVEYKFPKFPVVHEDAQDLIKKLIVKDPNARYQLNEILDHKWVRDNYSPSCAD